MGSYTNEANLANKLAPALALACSLAKGHTPNDGFDTELGRSVDFALDLARELATELGLAIDRNPTDDEAEAGLMKLIDWAGSILYGRVALAAHDVM